MSVTDIVQNQNRLATMLRNGVTERGTGKGQQRLLNKLLSISIYVLASLIGLAAFLYPFFTPSVQSGAAAMQQLAHGADSPLMLALLIGLCLAALAVEAQGQAMSAKVIALLGILVAINSALRFAEAIVRGPGGFSPVFMLIIMCGYVFGPRFGFLMGILSLLVSAIITGGIGPWLPYQMFTAGWMGMSAGWLGYLRDALAGLNIKYVKATATAPSRRWPGLQIIALCAFGALWGFIYGAIMNLWFWPFQTGDSAQTWQSGLGMAQGVQRYLAFYLATSFIWDVFAAIGNIVLLGLFGQPTLRALQRFRNRFMFTLETSLPPAARG
jgi:energy-coupling factor transport system substrate-specific component